jgi:hypothetical protein
MAHSSAFCEEASAHIGKHLDLALELNALGRCTAADVSADNRIALDIELNARRDRALSEGLLEGGQELLPSIVETRTTWLFRRLWRTCVVRIAVRP